MNMEAMIDKYFRPGRLPHIWCPGCGNGVVTGTIVKAVAKLDLDKDKVAVISGIGWSRPAPRHFESLWLQQPCLRLFRFQYRPFRTWTRFAGSDRR